MPKLRKTPSLILSIQREGIKKGFFLCLVLLAMTIASCKGLPEEPEIAICTPIIGYGDAPYVFCTSDINPDDPAKQFRIPLDQFLKDKPIMTSAVDYALKIKWAEEVKKWGEKNCKEKP